jgi:hypothetical protein
MHTKGHEHDKHGFLTIRGQKKYDLLLKAAKSGDQKGLQGISLAPRSERKFSYLKQ